MTKQPKRKTCNDTKVVMSPDSAHYVIGAAQSHIPCPNYPEQLNTIIIKTIQGLMTCANNELQKLDELTPLTPVTRRKVLISQAIDEIGIFQKTTLFDLQKASE